jgi:hypothetical protein
MQSSLRTQSAGIADFNIEFFNTIRREAEIALGSLPGAVNDPKRNFAAHIYLA